MDKMKVIPVQSELNMDEYVELKKRAEERGITLKEAVKEAISIWLHKNSVFNPEDPFFTTSKMFRSKKDLAERHDEIYRLYKFCHYEKEVS
ncbi:MAG: hypothetical protein J7K81_06355 [Methanophagales archaeon]|nr:hypothetical protein [Methanophagales archaeon]